MRKELLFVCIILIFVQVWAEPVGIAIVKRGQDSAWSGEMAAYYDQLESGIANSDAFDLKKDANLDKDFGIPITPDFAQIVAPVNLFEYHVKNDINVLLFVNAMENQFITHLIEFPSGVLLNVKQFGLQNMKSESIINSISSQINIYENYVSKQWQPFGFPFDQNDFGIIVVTDDVNSIHMSKTLDVLNNTFFDNSGITWSKSLKYKIIKQTTTCTDFVKMCTDSGAEFGLVFSKNKNNPVQAVFGPVYSNTPLLQIEYPIIPNVESFYCYSKPSDLFNPELFCDIVLNEQGDFANDVPTLDTLPLYLFSISRMHRSWNNGLIVSDTFKQQLYDNYNMIYRFIDENSPLKPWVALNFSALNRTLYKFQQSEKMLESAFKSFQASNNMTGVILCNLEMAKQYGVQQKWNNVEKIYADLLKKQSSQIDSSSIAEIHYNLGLLYEIKNDYQKSIEQHQKSLILYAHLRDTFSAMLPQSKICFLYRQMNDLVNAEASANSYLAIANELHSEPDVARARYELGLVHLAQNKLQLAQNDFIIAQNFFEMLDEKQYLAFIDLNLGVVHLKNKQFVKANPLLHKALRNAKELEEHTIIIDSYRYLGELETQMKNWKSAQNYYDLAVNKSLETGNTKKLAEVMYQKGLSHIKEGQLSVGYVEVKKGIELSDGNVHGGNEQAQAFLVKLEQIIASKRQEAGL